MAFTKRQFWGVFSPSNIKIMKFDMIANEIATKEHRTKISQFIPSMINKTHNTMKQNTAKCHTLPNCSFYVKSKFVI